eukprot:3847052-Rhodomonas_salina.3
MSTGCKTIKFRNATTLHTTSAKFQTIGAQPQQRYKKGSGGTHPVWTGSTAQITSLGDVIRAASTKALCECPHCQARFRNLVTL